MRQIWQDLAFMLTGSALVDSTLPPDKVSSLPAETSESSVSIASSANDFLSVSREVMPSLVIASAAVNAGTLQISRGAAAAAALIQVRLQDCALSRHNDASAKFSTTPGAFLSGFSQNMQPFVTKSMSDVHTMNVLEKAILATGPILVKTPSAGDGIVTQQQMVSNAFASTTSSVDALKAAGKSPGVNLYQPVFHAPFDGSHLIRDSKLPLSLGSLKNTSGSGDAINSSSTSATEITPGVRGMGCLSMTKPVVIVSSVNSQSQTLVVADEVMGRRRLQNIDEIESGILAKLKYEEAKRTTMGDDIMSQVTRETNGTTIIGLQEMVGMRLPTIDRHPSKILLPEPSVTGIDLKTSEVCDSVTSLDAVRISSSPFSATPARFTMYPESKLAMAREQGHRKSSRSTDDTSPRSKATLTVAKLLEKAENAKMSLQPVCKSIETGVVTDSSFRQSTIPLLLPFSESLTNITASQTELLAKPIASLTGTARVSFTNVSVNCLPKVSINLSAGFSLMDANPLPITSPGYPLNLTESVQKVMQGVGLDTSPPPSPRHQASSRISPSKFGTQIPTSSQSRVSVAFTSNTSTESKLKDIVAFTKASKTSLVSSVPDAHPCSDISLSLDSAVNVHSEKSLSNAVSAISFGLQDDTQLVLSRESMTTGVVEKSDGCSLESSSVSASLASIIISENSGGSISTESVDRPVEVPPMFCVVDHSYSALLDHDLKVEGKSVKDLHDSFEDLPENLNPVDDCHDELFDEMTESFGSHFEDKDLFVDDLIYHDNLGNFDQVLEVEAETCSTSNEVGMEDELYSEKNIDPVGDFDDSVEDNSKVYEGQETKESEEKLTEDSSYANGTEEMEAVNEKCQALQKMECSQSPRNEAYSTDNDPPKLEVAVQKYQTAVELKVFDNEIQETCDETMQTEVRLLTLSESSNAFSEDDILKLTVLNSQPCEMAYDTMQHIEEGNAIVEPDVECGSLKNLTQSRDPNTFPARRSKQRKGALTRKRRAGRFVPKNPAENKEDFVVVAEAAATDFHSVNDLTDIKKNMENSATHIVADKQYPLMETGALSTQPSSCRMMTRSSGRKSTRTTENADVAVSEDWSLQQVAPPAQQQNPSPIATKLCENNQRLECPVLLRRSTRTLRKTETVVLSSGISNCDDKAVPTKSCKRPGKDRVQPSISCRSVRGSDRHVVPDNNDEFMAPDDVHLTVENSQTGTLDGTAVTRETKEPVSKKSKT